MKFYKDRWFPQWMTHIFMDDNSQKIVHRKTGTVYIPDPVWTPSLIKSGCIKITKKQVLARLRSIPHPNSDLQELIECLTMGKITPAGGLSHCHIVRIRKQRRGL